jgi:hypothetical protein
VPSSWRARTSVDAKLPAGLTGKEIRGLIGPVHAHVVFFPCEKAESGRFGGVRRAGTRCKNRRAPPSTAQQASTAPHVDGVEQTSSQQFVHWNIVPESCCFVLIHTGRDRHRPVACSAAQQPIREENTPDLFWTGGISAPEACMRDQLADLE